MVISLYLKEFNSSLDDKKILKKYRRQPFTNSKKRKWPFCKLCILRKNIYTKSTNSTAFCALQ